MVETNVKEAPMAVIPFAPRKELTPPEKPEEEQRPVKDPAADKPRAQARPAARKAKAPQKKKENAPTTTTTTGQAGGGIDIPAEVMAEIQIRLDLDSNIRVSIGVNDLPSAWREAVKIYARKARGMGIGEFIVSLVNEELERSGLRV